MTEGMLEEIPAYGLDCGDASTNNVVFMMNRDAKNDRNTEGVTGLTFVLICLAQFLVWGLTVFQAIRWYEDRQERQKRKIKELKNPE